jgi:hypothetical protein
MTPKRLYRSGGCVLLGPLAPALAAREGALKLRADAGANHQK